MRIVIRLAVAALVLTFALPGTAPAVEKIGASTLAESGKAFAEAKEAFLNLFSGAPRVWAGELLERPDISRHDPASVEGDSDWSEKRRAKFLERRAAVTRYLTLAVKTPSSDPAFPLLIKPVCLYASAYRPARDPVADALAEYDAHVSDPFRDKDGYVIRRVNGQLWTVILMPRQELRSSNTDRHLAFVLRAEDGSFALNPIIAPGQESAYPREQAPLRPEKFEYGPGRVSLSTCTMEPVLTVTNESGPFTFRADIAQRVTGKDLAYLCEAKCTSFTYTWNETTRSFIMSDGICRDDDGWKPTSPFDQAGCLIPVAEYAQALAAENGAVRAHGQDVETAVAAYLDLFEGKALEIARAFVDGWRVDRNFPLYRLVGKKDAFAKAYVENDEAVLAYLRTVASLAKTPDARLTLLLGDLAARGSRTEKQEKEDDERRSPSALGLLRDGDRMPWFASYAARQLALLKEPDNGKPGSRNDRPYTATGLDGGEVITFTYDARSFLSPNGEAVIESRFLMRPGQDGDFWGHASDAVGNDLEDEDYSTPRQSLLLMRGGKVSVLTPPLPEEKDFFTNPVLDGQGKVLWALPGRRSPSFPPCDFTPALAVDTAAIPFAVRARGVMQEKSSSYICVPECEIPYTWDGAAYVRGEPECLPAGEWGIAQKTEVR